MCTKKYKKLIYFSCSNFPELHFINCVLFVHLTEQNMRILYFVGNQKIVSYIVEKLSNIQTILFCECLLVWTRCIEAEAKTNLLMHLAMDPLETNLCLSKHWGLNFVMAVQAIILNRYLTFYCCCYRSSFLDKTLLTTSRIHCT